MRTYSFSLSTHGAIELALGLATFVAAALLDVSSAGLVAAVIVGSLLAGLGVTVSDEPRGSLGWHQLCDLVLVLAIAVLACALAVSGEASAALVFAAVAALHSGLSVTTRYVAAR